ncbi:hypothetical protein BmR1_04g05055 [Babesia microti strain RI]|uniref:Nuclear speckle splicing regulatory protein 1 N-terminal domain-containing protein n=1 Tax=Babesia microti (strain RI) TaxID=1133968 RepID=I7JCI2_BABMR|nr:hypothetical protein BmR1_04g05055 [Babesia microti strain RI]CCF75210.1 hypothetical protein BmR1_04g05055 [Babesia microti strain RI]|eukprot:XP_012649618.1 hypothetical protein BmR1_04g05055 [Babesia microti strain RI]
MKFSLPLKKPTSANSSSNVVNKIDQNAIKNVSVCFASSESDIKPVPKAKQPLNFTDDPEKQTTIASETCPFQLKIKFKESTEALEDQILTQYDEFVEPSKEASFKPVYLNVGNKDETIKPEERPKARYIEKLVKTAQKREIERDLIIGKKEREGAQGDVFVTNAYRKKLEEREKIIQKMMEQDKSDEIEAMNKNLSALHKNMLDSEGWKRRHT